MTVPKQHVSAIAVSLALLTTGEHAIAQSASEQKAPELESRLEAGAVMSQRVGTLPLSAIALTPGFRYSANHIDAAARGTLQLADGWRVGAGAASLEAYTPSVYGFRAEVIAGAERAFFEPGVQNDQLSAEGRVHYMRQRGGIWLGSGVSRPLRISAVQNVNVNTGGLWTKLGATTVRTSVTSFFFTKVSAADSLDIVAPCARYSVPTTTGSGFLMASLQSSSGCKVQSRFTDLETSVRYEHRTFEATLRGGGRFGDSFDVTPESRHWVNAQAAFWVSDQLAAVAGGGREPAQPTRGLPARTYGTLGLMLAYWPIPRGSIPVEAPAAMIQMFDLRPAGKAVQRITVRIGHVESVDVMGDFSDWAPMPLIRRGRDLWELLLPMSAGVHQINLRIDGGPWIAPPGVPTMKDGFNGEVGVLVIKQ